MTGWAEQALGDGGYAVLALLMLVENLFPPIPSEVILPLAGASVARGTLGFELALLAATAGSVAGAVLLYGLGRFGGRPLLLRHGRLLRLSPSRLDRADQWFDRHGVKLVLAGRLIPGARSVISIPAGAAQMPFALFVLLTVAGSAAWNAALIGAGLALGENWERASRLVGQASTVALGGAAAAFVAAVLIHRRRRRRGTQVRRRSGP